MAGLTHIKLLTKLVSGRDAAVKAKESTPRVVRSMLGMNSAGFVKSLWFSCLGTG